MKIGRRIVLLGGTIAVGLAGMMIFDSGSLRAAIRAFIRYYRPQPSVEEKALELLATLPHVQIDRDAAIRFIEVYIEEFDTDTKFSITDNVRVRFLLSTDYVQGENRWNREAKWVAFYSPWRSPCYNPFMLRQPKS